MGQGLQGFRYRRGWSGRKITLLGFVLIGAALLVLVGYTGYQSVKAKEALERVAVDFEALSVHLKDGDLPAARSALDDARSDAAAARENTSGVGWWVLGHLPWIGANTEAVRRVALISDALAADVLPQVVSATETLQPNNFRPVNGRIDLQTIRENAPQVVQAATALAVESRRAQAIDVAPLAASIAEPIRRLQEKMAYASSLADRASRAVRLAPVMLGGDGKRRYLFMFQNNAELRSTGGIPGGFAVITAENGKMTVDRQDSASRIGRFEKAPTPTTSAETALFGAEMGLLPQAVTSTPDFPRSAQLMVGMWKARNRQTVDGVVSVDPIALSYLLDGVGPVRTVGGRNLTSDNAVRVLLSDVYSDISYPPLQNRFFNAAARAVLARFTAGAGDPRVTLEGAVRAVSERRMLVWSQRPSEQRLLGPTAIGSALIDRASDAPDLGLYLNSIRPSKLAYYLDYKASVRSTTCIDGVQHLQVRVGLRSRVPRNTDSLPAYVAPKRPGWNRGTMSIRFFFFAPIGGRTTDLLIDGEPRPFKTHALKGRSAVTWTSTIEPGERVGAAISAQAGPGQRDTAKLRVTPGVRGTGMGPIGPTACS